MNIVHYWNLDRYVNIVNHWNAHYTSYDQLVVSLHFLLVPSLFLFPLLLFHQHSFFGLKTLLTNIRRFYHIAWDLKESYCSIFFQICLKQVVRRYYFYRNLVWATIIIKVSLLSWTIDFYNREFNVISSFVFRIEACFNTFNIDKKERPILFITCQYKHLVKYA